MIARENNERTVVRANRNIETPQPLRGCDSNLWGKVPSINESSVFCGTYAPKTAKNAEYRIGLPDRFCPVRSYRSSRGRMSLHKSLLGFIGRAAAGRPNQPAHQRWREHGGGIRTCV